MTGANPASDRPLVSVIVPARNEEVSLGACLESLVAQTGVNKEIIVVDDGSTDRTHEIAASFTSVRVIDPSPLPDGWTGKNNAVTAGAKVAQGEWLLFTDADTVHRLGSLERSLAEAKEKGASLLSYSPKQEACTFLEKAVMPLIFAELALTYRPSEVSDPKSPVAAANGQYILIAREAYDAVGGHSAIAMDLLEDVALARLVKRSGRKISFRFAADAVSTRMYRSFAQLREGWTKNLALLFSRPVELAAQQFVVLLAVVFAPAAAIYDMLFFRNRPFPGDDWFHLYSLLVNVFAFMWGAWHLTRRIRMSHFPWSSFLFSVFGLPIFAYLLVRSDRSFKKARVNWKNRSYVYSAEEIETLRAEITSANRSGT